MSLLHSLVSRFLFPPEPTPTDKLIDGAIETGKTVLDVSELINEVLPEKGPHHVQVDEKALGSEYRPGSHWGRRGV